MMKVKVSCCKFEFRKDRYILRLNRDQTCNFKACGWEFNPRPLDQRSTDWATEAVAVSLGTSSVYMRLRKCRSFRHSNLLHLILTIICTYSECK